MNWLLWIRMYFAEQTIISGNSLVEARSVLVILYFKDMFTIKEYPGWAKPAVVIKECKTIKKNFPHSYKRQSCVWESQHSWHDNCLHETFARHVLEIENISLAKKFQMTWNKEMDFSNIRAISNEMFLVEQIFYQIFFFFLWIDIDRYCFVGIPLRAAKRPCQTSTPPVLPCSSPPAHFSTWPLSTSSLRSGVAATATLLQEGTEGTEGKDWARWRWELWCWAASFLWCCPLVTIIRLTAQDGFKTGVQGKQWKQRLQILLVY